MTFFAVPFKAPPVPGPEKTVDQTFEVALPTSVEEPTMRFDFGRAEIAVARGLLEKLVAEKPERWSNEDERQALMAGHRAKLLLDGAAGHGKGMKPALGEGEYLLATLLESGHAVVRLRCSQVPARRLLVNFHGSSWGPMIGMGHITISTADPPVHLLSLSWFVR
jgi:hypothetical protein